MRDGWRALVVAGSFLYAPSLCVGQQVAFPQCPEYAGTLQVSASCITDILDLAFDAAGTGWIVDGSGVNVGRVLHFPGIKVGQVPSPNQTADLVIGKPNFSTLTNSSCVACSLGGPVKLAFDKAGALWVADEPSPGQTGPGEVHRFSPPFSNGQAADLIIATDASGGIAFDANGNLWIASIYSCGHVLEYSPPFSSTMQPTVVLGAPTAATCVSTPGPNVLNGVQGIAFDAGGNLYVGDSASSRVAIYKPPFQTFMNAAAAIGQPNLSSYQPVQFAQGGLAGILDLAIDATGKLWVLANSQDVAVYSPPFATGMAMAFWFDFVTGQMSNGGTFPYTFNGYSSLRFAVDSSLWFASGEGYSGLGTFAVLTPSAIQQVELSPAISFIASSATGTSPFTAEQLVSIYGTQLGPLAGAGAQIGAGGAVTTSDGGTRVLFNGVAAPILYAGASQVNASIPCSVAGQPTVQVVVSYQGAQSAPVTLALGPAAPGIFTVNGSGTGQAAVLHQDFTLNGPSNPAERGSAIVIYATGIGVTAPCIDGQIYASNFPTATLPVEVGVGDIGAQILYSGQAPDLVSGVAQINAVVPNDSPTGVVTLTLLVGGVLSPPGVTIAVK